MTDTLRELRRAWIRITDYNDRIVAVQIRPGFWMTALAIALGVLLGVYAGAWLDGQDNTPEAAGRTLYRPLPVTPGVARDLTRKQICETKWSADRRHVTLAMKQHVAAAYGIPWSEHSKYEFDHLIPRELGGADVESNLWPQPWIGPYNAHDKDRLENQLRRLVCSGQITLEFAQDAISSDWIAAFRLYVPASR